MSYKPQVFFQCEAPQLPVCLSLNHLPIQQWSHIILFQPFAAKVATEALLVLDVLGKCQLQFIFGFPKTILTCPSNVLNFSFLSQIPDTYVCFPKYQNGLLFSLEDTVFKDLPTRLNSLPFRATFHGIPLISFLNRLRSAHLKSRVCTLVLSFFTPFRISNSAASWSLQPGLSLLGLWIPDPAVCHPWVGQPVPLSGSYLTLQKSPGLLLFLPREVKEIKVFHKNRDLWYRDFLKLFREDFTLFLILVGWFVPNSPHEVPLLASPLQGDVRCVREE